MAGQKPNANLAHKVHGERGTPLVLLHGFPLDSRMWSDQAANLAERCRVITPDFGGFGGSVSTAPFTMESLADEVHALLESIGALPAVIAGLSMGGYVALAYARKYPQDLKGLVLVDTRAEADSAEAREGRAQMIDLVRREGATAVAEKMLPKLLAPDTPEKRPHVVARLRAIMESARAEAIEHALAAMRDRADQTAHLPSIAAPTLIIVGDADAVTPPKLSEAMRDAIPNSTLVVVRGAGHMTPMEQPAQVNQALRTFLEQVG